MNKRYDGKTIVVADDHQGFRIIYRNLIECYFKGIKVLEADSGEGLVRLVDDLSGNVSLVVIDVSMETPMAGFEATRQLRERGYSFKVLINSNRDSEEVIEGQRMDKHAQQSGADSYMVKGDADLAIETIRKMLG